jgi:hypothetical protein
MEFVIFLVYYLLNAIVLFLKREYYEWLKQQACTDSTNLVDQCQCAFLYPSDSGRYVRN